MKDKVLWTKNECEKKPCKSLSLMNRPEMEKVRAFHKSFPQYERTPLVKLDNLAKKIGVKGIYVKDESYRFGLNAFKVLGGSFAMAKYIAGILKCDVSELTYDKLISRELRDKIGQVTFFTATDGNHGRGVAWAANKLGQKSVVYMPTGSSQIRLDNIRKEGADASIIDGGYTKAVRLATQDAKKVKNGVVIQDTAWEGYEEIPGWIMQGYGTMAAETEEQLHEYEIKKPTHIFVQAGVGSLAGAIQGYFSNVYGETCPVTTVIEPAATDCHYRSALAKKWTAVDEGETIMAGLNCGEPNTISWDILKNESSFFTSVPDNVAAYGMRILSSPLRGDGHVISGESGAVGAGLLASIMQDADMAEFKKELKLGEDSEVLLFSTEGDTDPDKYLDIVWSGEYASRY